MNEFDKNWNWQLNFLDEIKDILKKQSMYIVDVQVASPDEDMKQSTDLKIKITAGTLR